MTYTLRRYQSYQDYLDDAQLHHERNYRLLSTGEAIEVADEDDRNLWLANTLIAAILQVMGIPFIQLIRNGNKDLQVNPVGDKWVNRKPDVLVMCPEHLQDAKQAIKLGQTPPKFVAEVVSPGNQASDNYRRDYLWKRQQYQTWQIPEYWIIDPHREQVTVLTLVSMTYHEKVYTGEAEIVSTTFPGLTMSAKQLFDGKL
ncbi:MAG: Uma2 family endonuclease [Cyanobacteria bacterium P01_A01_bin.116]